MLRISLQPKTRQVCKNKTLTKKFMTLIPPQTLELDVQKSKGKPKYPTLNSGTIQSMSSHIRMQKELAFRV